MLGLTFSYVISNTKIASKKIEALICSVKFLSPEVALYLHKSTTCPSMEYVVTSGLEPLMATWNCQTISYKNEYEDCWYSLAASSQPLAHHRNVASLSLFYSYYFGRCSELSELAQLVPLPFSRERSTRDSDRLHDFSATISRSSSHNKTLKLSAYIEYFPLTHALLSFSCGFFLKRFPLCFNLFVLLLLVTPRLVVAVQPCMK